MELPWLVVLPEMALPPIAMRHISLPIMGAVSSQMESAACADTLTPVSATPLPPSISNRREINMIARRFTKANIRKNAEN